MTGYFDLAWRSVIAGIAYMVGLALTGVALGALGFIDTAQQQNQSEYLQALLFITGCLIGGYLGIFARRLTASRRVHILIWSSIVFFNMGSVAIEGAYFVPEQVKISLGALFSLQLGGAILIAVGISYLFASVGAHSSFSGIFARRAWHSWLWRFLVGSASYIFFYFVFGALNFYLVTEPYYASHEGGLTVPPAHVVFIAESIRGPLIVLSVLPLVLFLAMEKRRLAMVTGFTLFWVGGVAPLLLQIGMLPLPLIIASLIEIFFQSFLTGVVVTLLFWLPQAKENIGAGT